MGDCEARPATEVSKPPESINRTPGFTDHPRDQIIQRGNMTKHSIVSDSYSSMSASRLSWSQFPRIRPMALITGTDSSKTISVVDFFAM